MDIPYQFRVNNDYKYMFTIVDHFSKLADSFLLKNETSKNIVESLNQYIELYVKPVALSVFIPRVI